MGPGQKSRGPPSWKIESDPLVENRAPPVENMTVENKIKNPLVENEGDFFWTHWWKIKSEMRIPVFLHHPEDYRYFAEFFVYLCQTRDVLILD